MALTLDPEVAWYVNESDGACGLHGAALELCTASHRDHDGVSDDEIRAAARVRRVEAALRGLLPKQRDALRLSHRRLSPRVHLDVRRRIEEWTIEHHSEIMIAMAEFRRRYDRV